MDSSLFYSPRKSTFINRMNQRIKLKPIFSNIKRFYTLVDAIKRLKEIQENAIRTKDNRFFSIFSKEFYNKQSAGTRYFMVLSIEMFVKIYKAVEPKTRNYYELILHDSHCKLYLDVEYLYENLKEESRQVVKVLITSLSEFILLELKISVDIKDFIILDSSNDVKFSLHVILSQEKLVFVNNVNLGRFIKDFVELSRSNGNNKYLFDFNGNCIIDKTVYTKNRNFRIYKSTKLGQKRPLVISRFNRYPAKDKEVLLKTSLITYFEHGLKETQVVRYKVLPDDNLPRKVYKPTNTDFGETLFLKHSSFPLLDKYFESVLRTKNGKVYKIREIHIKGILHVHYYPQNYRFCNRIKREHKSNGIYYIVDTYLKMYWQQCFDIECKGFKSDKIGLPKTLFDKKL